MNLHTTMRHFSKVSGVFLSIMFLISVTYGGIFSYEGVSVYDDPYYLYPLLIWVVVLGIGSCSSLYFGFKKTEIANRLTA